MTQTDGEIYHWKNQYCENDYNTQSTDLMQSLSNHPWHFLQNQKKNLKICMETQNIPNSQSNLEGKKKKELEESDSLISD